MEAIFYSLLTIGTWGTWLAPSQKVVFRNNRVRTFYVALANLALASAVAGFQDISGLDGTTFVT